MTSAKIGAFLLIVVAIILIYPALIIWSLNTLFPALAIPFTLETWFAAALINGLVFAGRGAAK